VAAVHAEDSGIFTKILKIRHKTAKNVVYLEVRQQVSGFCLLLKQGIPCKSLTVFENP
jgi:hypothetical protein